MSSVLVTEIPGVVCETIPSYLQRALNPGIIIEEALTTSEAIRKYYHDGKVAAMNFANAFSPGGGTAFHRGDRIVRTQEENILTLTPDAYTAILENKHLYPLCRNGNRSLYLQGVNLTLEDDFTDSLNPCQYDMLVAPAIDVHNSFIRMQRRFLTDERLIDKYMRPMLHNLLLECVKNQITTVILGPWGCGVFAPHDYTEKEVYVALVMKMMNEVVSEFLYYFPQIVFTKPMIKSQEQLDYEASRKKDAEMFASWRRRMFFRNKRSRFDEESSSDDWKKTLSRYFFPKEKRDRRPRFVLDDEIEADESDSNATTRSDSEGFLSSEKDWSDLGLFQTSPLMIEDNPNKSKQTEIVFE